MILKISNKPIYTDQINIVKLEKDDNCFYCSISLFLLLELDENNIMKSP